MIAASSKGSRLNPDRIGGFLWLAFGVVVTVASWRMDRLESQNIQPATAPGLLPGLIGLGLIAFSLVLILRRQSVAAAGYDGAEPAEAGSAVEPFAWGRLALSWCLCIAFAGLALGRGLPFWLLVGTFVTLHVLLLDDPDRVERLPLARRALTAVLVAAGTATVVTLVFQRVFLIRLP